MATYRALLKTAKADIREIDPETAEARLGDATFLDVREQDEFEQGMIPGSVFIPRGHLEAQAENKLPNRDAPIVIYCAGGNRSAFAAKTLQDLGYTDVVSTAGGFGRWKNQGRTWITPAVLDPEQRNRYSRHILLPEVGEAGRQKLLESRGLVPGAGGLGSPAALYLAAAGVGTLGIVDMDVVDASNLQRQILHNTDRIGERKVASAKDKLNAINPNVKIELYETALTSQNALELFAPYDVILDGTDNFPTRYLVNDACVLLGKPNAYGSIFRFEGQASVFATKEGPCYRCLYPEPPPPGLVPSCAEGGVLGILPGLVGVIQATEVIKLILGKGSPLIGRLLLVDALGMRFSELKLRKNPECPVCGENPTVKELIDYEHFCGIVPESKEEKAIKNGIPQLGVKELKQRIDAGEYVFIVDVREPYEYQIAQIGGKLIPQNDIPQRLAEIPRDREIVVQCRSGARSQRIAEFLRQSGYAQVVNLAGGILAWSDEIDPKVQKY